METIAFTKILTKYQTYKVKIQHFFIIIQFVLPSDERLKISEIKKYVQK